MPAAVGADAQCPAAATALCWAWTRPVLRLHRRHASRCHRPRPARWPPAGLPQWCSVAPHVEPLLCGITAVGELLLWDICREGLPVLTLISTEDPRLKQIRLFWKQATHCTAVMAYHQMAPISSSALEAAQQDQGELPHGMLERPPSCVQMLWPLQAAAACTAPACTCARRPCWPRPIVILPVSALQCMHLFRDTSPVLLATGGAPLSWIGLHCR
jgi:hypothetical protein